MPSSSSSSSPTNPAANEPPGNTERPSSANEWVEIGRLIQRQIRRDLARVVGAPETDDWGEVRDTVTGRIRERVTGVETGEIGQRAERIARDLEEQFRVGLAQTFGAGRDADWASIGRTVSERLRRTIDPNQTTGPGGSGTAASAEDSAVPAAASSPDSAPRPGHDGGDDSGLPTVTDEVGELPHRSL